jgi:hypothetical protein
MAACERYSAFSADQSGNVRGVGIGQLVHNWSPVRSLDRGQPRRARDLRFPRFLPLESFGARARRPPRQSVVGAAVLVEAAGQ